MLTTDTEERVISECLSRVAAGRSSAGTLPAVIAAKDIQKIFRQYNIEGIQLQTNDAQSVSLWVKEINDQCADGSDNLILLYKPQVVEPEGELQGSLNKKDFCVCIQTSFC